MISSISCQCIPNRIHLSVCFEKTTCFCNSSKKNLFQFLYLFDNQAYCEFVPVKNIYIIIKYWMFYFLWGNFLKIFIIFGRRSKALNVCGLDQDLFPKCVSGHADSFYICRFSVAQVVPEIQAKLDISWVKLISTITKM